MRGERGSIRLLLAAGSQPAVTAGALLGAARQAVADAGGRALVYHLRGAAPAQEEALRAAGWRELRVEGMTLARPAEVVVAAPPAGYHLVPWQAEHLQGAARVFQMLPRDPLEALLWPALETDAGRRELLAQLAHPCASFIAAFGAGEALEVVGYVLAGVASDGRGRIGELGVAPAHQRRGLGRALLTAAVRSLAAAGAREVQLTVWAGNAPAQALYRSLGFEAMQAQSVYVWQAGSASERIPGGL
jgi:ribosomal protein S18 acetylase RimI-like enzyme